VSQTTARPCRPSERPASSALVTSSSPVVHKQKGHGMVTRGLTCCVVATGVILPVASETCLARGCSGQARQRQEDQSWRREPRVDALHARHRLATIPPDRREGQGVFRPVPRTSPSTATT